MEGTNNTISQWMKKQTNKKPNSSKDNRRHELIRHWLEQSSMCKLF